ncbi:alpha/beta hydrolase [Streptomyces sp. NPDC005202]|uniref:alpha/beta fold hydrolase n=1 Tax=Streptomyces sp. NPDC005202 TaxID=3157021 RepID=UPI0033A58F97
MDKDVMVSSIRELTRRDYWREWEGLTCPALVVRGENGTMPETEFTAMQTRRPDTTLLLTIPDAAHDVHLDQPARLYEAVAAFLRGRFVSI